MGHRDHFDLQAVNNPQRNPRAIQSIGKKVTELMGDYG
jgi:hypothetical protein